MSSYTRDYPIDLPAGSVDAHGDAIAEAQCPCGGFVGHAYECKYSRDPMTEIPKYLPIPELAPQGETEPIGFYGLRILTFVLETRITATLDRDQLELADHFASVAVQSREIEPIAVDRISEARHAIKRSLREIRRRAHEADLLAALSAPSEATSETSSEAETELDKLSPAEQAVKLLRASLAIVVGVDPGDDSDPSGRVPRQPKPRSPQPSTSLPNPGRTEPRERVF